MALAGLMLWMASGASYGLGLGHPVSRAILGDTLSVSVPVRLDAGEELSADCIKAEVYFGDDKLPSSRIQTQLQAAPAPIGHKSEPVIQVRTSALINEPVVTLYLSAGCQTRITRKVVALVDPPDLTVPVAGAARQASAPDTGSANEGRTAPTNQASHPVKVVRDPASRLSGLGRQAASFSLSADEKPVKSGRRKKPRDEAAARKTNPSPVEPRAPRLVLDPVATDATVTPGLQMTGGLTAAVPDAEASSPEVLQRRRSAAAIWHAMNASPEETAREQARLEELERKLDSLTRDSVRASEAVTGLQSRLTHVSLAGNGVVYGLMATVAVLLGVLGWREWTLRKAMAEQSSWLVSQSSQAFDEVPPSPDPAMTPEAADVPGPVEDPAPPPAVRSASGMDIHRAQDALQPLPEVEAPSATAAGGSSWTDVSIEELIDLEQQAEFFLVLGQDESAIEVLEGYISSTTALSPMPFLKLLEIYRRLGMRGAYERTRMNFNLRFNAHAPLWESDLTHGHELKDYPGVIERLQMLWAYPDKALAVLERSLMRQDAESYTFDLPAYRELLFLYSILRDLQQHRDQPGHDERHRQPVDVLVASTPLGLGRESTMASAIEADLDLSSPLMATLPMKALPDLAPTLSLDLELDDLYVDPPPADHKP